jgi:hypothetical protein
MAAYKGALMEMEPRRRVELSWAKMAVVTVALWSGILLFSPWMDSADPEIFFRMLANKLLTLTLFTLVATGCLLWIDRVTPGDWLEKIHENPVACAVVFGVILYCLAWCFTWA